MMSTRRYTNICNAFVLGIFCLLNFKTEAATIVPPVLPHGSNFVGEGTNELASELLQGFVNEEKNFVFSPLGYTVTLGVLAEGARGNTRNQLVNALHLPEDTYAVRETFKKVLGNLRSCLICDDNTENIPQFKNWFYVYKNFTIDESYKKVLEENYATDVLSVERPDEETDMNIDVQFTTESQPTTENISSSSEEEQTVSEGDSETTTAVVNSAVKFENEAVAALSVNKISAKEKGSGREIVSKMITFNGLYYRGKWSTPFEIIKDAEEKSFYVSNDKKKPVTMLRTEGIFEIGNLPALDATAIELPYTGDRYSLLILLPNARDGLVKLTADLAGYSLSRFYMKKQLTSKMAEIFLPKFTFQTISKPEKVLTEFGVKDLFSENADLSGISKNAGLFLDELVQLVTVEVDERSTQTNFITAAGIESSRNNFEKIKVDHPFLFFVRDKIDNVIIAAGKVLDPTKKN